MALLDNTTQRAYYQGGDQGNYQFVSLEDIINQFMIIYVGEEKIISKAKRTDVAFHAQRALAELSFDTFKSVKSQEIELPPSLTMMLPHDYVGYTKICWSDGSGIKRPLYPTKHTSNPFNILQDDDKTYDFTIPSTAVLINGDFSQNFGQSGGWISSPHHGSQSGSALGIVNGQYEWTHATQSLSGSYSGRHFAIWQEINVSEIETLTLSAKGLSSNASGTAGIVRVGISTIVDFNQIDPTTGYDPNRTNPSLPNLPSRNLDPTIYDTQTLGGAPGYIEFNAGDNTLSAATELADIDVSAFTTVHIVVVSSGGQSTSSSANSTNAVDDIVLTFDADTNNLQSSGNSDTWTDYLGNVSNATSDAKAYNYDSDVRDIYLGQRHGIEPSHAQSNGSFYIDDLKGLIHFSSNISGKTVVLDYISDSLGTDAEMKVHKFAEEAMYKWILHAILSTRINTQEYIIQRFKKERFAAIRQAKLRLSNIKLEEIAQILRGKSKWIKH
jgi:hypothetical protein